MTHLLGSFFLALPPVSYPTASISLDTGEAMLHVCGNHLSAAIRAGSILHATDEGATDHVCVFCERDLRAAWANFPYQHGATHASMDGALNWVAFPASMSQTDAARAFTAWQGEDALRGARCRHDYDCGGMYAEAARFHQTPRGWVITQRTYRNW